MKHHGNIDPVRLIERQLGIRFTRDLGIRNWVRAEFGTHPLFACSLHGYPHWLSVYANARELCRAVPNLSPHERDLVRVAAYLHDVGRLSPGASQGVDTRHGRASERAIRAALPRVAQRFGAKADVAAIGLLARSHIDETDIVQRRLARGRLAFAADIVREADSLDFVRLEAGGGESFDPTRLRFGEKSLRLVPLVRARWQAWLRQAAATCRDRARTHPTSRRRVP